MKITPITCMEVSLDKEEVETLKKTQEIIMELIRTIKENSLAAAECGYDDTFYIDASELAQMNFSLGMLKEIKQITH